MNRVLALVQQEETQDLLDPLVLKLPQELPFLARKRDQCVLTVVYCVEL